MQGSLLATLIRFPLFRFGSRHAEAPRQVDVPAHVDPAPADRALARQANEKLIRELGLWETFMHGGEKPTIRR